MDAPKFLARNIVSSLLLVACAFPKLEADDRITIEVKSVWSVGGSDSPDEVFKAVEHLVRQGSFDPRAKDLLDGTETFTKRVFNVPSLEFQRARTDHDSSGDCLIAEWKFRESYAKGSILLRDTPYYSAYSIVLDSDSWRTQQGVVELLHALIEWGKDPVRLLSLNVSIPSTYPVPAEFAGRPPTLFTPVGFIRDFYFSGRVANDQLYLEFNVGKAFTDGIYPVKPLVPERFPPLHELVQSWDDDKILTEVGKPAGPSQDLNFSVFRDSILIGELARRGITGSELTHLLSSVPVNRLVERAGVVFQALENAGKSGDFDRYFSLILRVYQGIGPSADPAVREMFRVPVRRKSCRPAFETAAIDLLRQRMFQVGAVNYLAECSTSKDAENAVESAELPKEMIDRKEVALSQIRARSAQRR